MSLQLSVFVINTAPGAGHFINSSNVHVSNIYKVYGSCSDYLKFVTVVTHPDNAALVVPLFAFCGKREGNVYLYCVNPLSAAGEERVVQRSVDRMSQILMK
jgi:hypothetical protein